MRGVPVVIAIAVLAIGCNSTKKSSPVAAIRKALADTCDRPGETYCTSPWDLVDCGLDGLAASATNCESLGLACGYDVETRRPACVSEASIEACDRPGETICLSRVDSGRCSDQGVVEPGLACHLRGELCGWDDIAGVFGCVPAPRECGDDGSPCCNLDNPEDPSNHLRGCALGLACVDRACVPVAQCNPAEQQCCGSSAVADVDGDWSERVCQPATPGCGGRSEACCEGSFCRLGGRCVDGLCELAPGDPSCSHENEVCCVGGLCSRDLTCENNRCVRVEGGEP